MGKKGRGKEEKRKRGNEEIKERFVEAKEHSQERNPVIFDTWLIPEKNLLDSVK